MTTILSAIDRAALLNDRSAELRSYSLRLAVVASVDNQGEQCQYCAREDQAVIANVYCTDFNGDTHCADTCGDCIAYIIDSHVDADPDHLVIIEIAQGVR